MLCWQHVERSLFALYYAFFDANVLMQCSATYYTLEAFAPKLRIVDATAKVVLHAAELRNWERLKTRILSACSDRNVLAHFTVVAKFFPDNSYGLVMAPASMMPPQLKRKRSKKYDAAECARLEDEFTKLAKEIDQFVFDVRPGAASPMALMLANNLPVTNDQAAANAHPT